jgi:hypothetical protein
MAKLHDERASLAKKIANYQELQSAYMPGLERSAAERGDGGLPEHFKPLLPSFLSAERRLSARCRPQLLEYEDELREAAAHQALDDVRRHLLAQTALYADKRQNSQSVVAGKRTQDAIKSVHAKVMRAFHRYRRHWTVLELLRPCGTDATSVEWRQDLQPLLREHLLGLNTNEAVLCEKASVRRAQALVEPEQDHGDNERDDGADHADGDAGHEPIDAFSEPFQLGQRGRTVLWIWPHADLSEHAGDSRQRLPPAPW